MTFNGICEAVSAYLQKESLSAFDIASGDNLVRRAVNNARKHAERTHDFTVCRHGGFYTFTNKTAWDSPVWFDSAEEKMRKPVNWWKYTGSTLPPTEFTRESFNLRVLAKDTKHLLDQNERYDEAFYSSAWRYIGPESNCPSRGPLLGQEHGLLNGKWLEYYPQQDSAVTLIVDGYRWWPAWVVSGGSSDRTLEIPVPSLAEQVDGIKLQIFFISDDPGEATRSFFYEFDDDTIVDPGSVPLTMPVSTIAMRNSLESIFGPTEVEFSVSGGSVVVTVPLGFNCTFQFNYSNGYVGTGTVTYNGQGDVEDWWTLNAEEYLMWRGIVEANKLGHVFTGNREANLPAPTREAESALQTLILSDGEVSDALPVSGYY